jgi:hypothetical protein
LRNGSPVPPASRWDSRRSQPVTSKPIRRASPGTWTFERKLAALSAIVAADHSRGWDAVMIERPTEFHRTTPVLIVGLRTSNPNVGGGAAYVLDPANLVAQ